MNLHEVLGLAGGHKARKRCGRGESSGLGKTSGRGSKGAKARSGWRRRYGYEGGQMPIVRRLPKRGFNNFNFATYFDVVNVGDLSKAFVDGEKVTRDALIQKGVLNPRFENLKILGDGTLDKKLEVVAHRASEGAKRKIEAAGGKLQCLIPPRPIHKPPPKPAPPAAPEGGATEKDKKAEKKKAKAEAAAAKGVGEAVPQPKKKEKPEGGGADKRPSPPGEKKK